MSLAQEKSLNSPDAQSVLHISEHRGHNGEHDDFDDTLTFERMVCKLLVEFTNLHAEDVDPAITRAQRRIVEALGLDRSTLFELQPDRSTLVFTHYWARPGFSEPPKRVDVHEHFPWCAARLLRRDAAATPRAITSVRES
jgi:hypothetical protein